MIMLPGFFVRLNIVSLVSNSTVSRPAIGGMNGVEPVAMTKRRALI